jgi:NADH-quinone oxidoreductase subunit H
MTDFRFWHTILIIVAVMLVILGTVAYLVLIERKVAAYVQDRLGPNRVGPWGLLQPIADGLKMFLKEDIVPSHVDKLFYFVAPAIAMGTALLAFTVVPFGPTAPPPMPVHIARPTPSAEEVQTYEAQLSSYQQQYSFVIAPGLDIGILFSFAVGSLAVYGIILGGWSANNKYSLLGSLRSSAQIISYEIPLGMSILGVVLYAGSLNLERVIDWQANHGWFILFQPLAFLLFMTGVFAECNRLPFDLPEAEQELVGGYHTEYSSMKLGLFLLGEYAHMMTTSFLMAVIFLGGWHFPGIDYVGGSLGVVLKFLIVALKMGLFVMLYMLVRWTIPRFRFDQLMGMAWKVLIPLSIVNLVCVMCAREFAVTPWVLTVASLGLLFGAALLARGKRPMHTFESRRISGPTDADRR